MRKNSSNKMFSQMFILNAAKIRRSLSMRKLILDGIVKPAPIENTLITLKK